MMMMAKFNFSFPKPEPGQSVEEYVEQGYGYPPYAHQPESNAPETGKDEPPPEEG